MVGAGAFLQRKLLALQVGQRAQFGVAQHQNGRAIGLGRLHADVKQVLAGSLGKHRRRLTGPAIIYEPESPHALGVVFRCGFLGLLHMEIVKERLEREFDLDLLATAPSVEYHIMKTNGEMISIHSPQDMPDPGLIDHLEEPYLKVTVLVPPEYVGAVMELNDNHRSTFVNMQYLSATTVDMHYEMPLSELIMDYFDQLKSRTKGYASLDYEYIGYRESELVKLDVLLAGKPVDALSFIVHKDKAYARGKGLTEKLRKILPRQMFEGPTQAANGGGGSGPATAGRRCAGGGGGGGCSRAGAKGSSGRSRSTPRGRSPAGGRALPDGEG